MIRIKEKVRSFTSATGTFRRTEQQGNSYTRSANFGSQHQREKVFSAPSLNSECVGKKSSVDRPNEVIPLGSSRVATR